jgi:3-isopropylmalate dehydrogenase
MSDTFKIVVLPGDGIGPDVIHEALGVLEHVGSALGKDFSFTQAAAGGAAIDRYGEPMPDDVLDECRNADAVFLGAVGGPKWDDLTGNLRPESGLLKLRKSLDVFANLRPVIVPESLTGGSPLRPEVVRGTDLLVVRELTSGIYFGEPKGREGRGDEEFAFNTMRYTAAEIKRVARVAFEWARKRRGHVTSVDKANVLVVSQLWRNIVERLHEDEFPEVDLVHLYVDNAAMQLVLRPTQFDVILTSNLFGDILSDAAATLPGSLGLLPSASVGGTVGLFEPVHGSAPDIAGQNKANPIAAILSAAMLLDYLDLEEGAKAVRNAVAGVLESGLRTGDIWKQGHRLVSTSEMGQAIRQQAIENLKGAVV